MLGIERFIFVPCMITRYPNYNPHMESCPCAHDEGIQRSGNVTPLILDLNPR